MVSKSASENTTASFSYCPFGNLSSLRGVYHESLALHWGMKEGLIKVAAFVWSMKRPSLARLTQSISSAMLIMSTIYPFSIPQLVMRRYQGYRLEI